MCPECQRQAPVGVQCVGCVDEAARSSPRTRTAFGGRAGDGRPRVTLTLIGLNVAVFLLQQVPGLDVTRQLSFVPFLAAQEPWRFITAAFLHSPSFVLHIAFNMYLLWVLGPYLEQLLGRARFAALYLVSALGGSVGFLLIAPMVSNGFLTSTVGASGAVFGLFGALVVVNRRLGRQFGQAVVLIALNGVLGFVVPGIAWQAHLGGLLTGAAVAAVMAYAPRRSRTPLQVAGTAAVVLVLALASIARIAAT